jgi:hypothetical protein
VAGAKLHLVLALATPELVLALAAFHLVVAHAAPELVIALAAQQRVIAGFAPELVPAIAAARRVAVSSSSAARVTSSVTEMGPESTPSAGYSAPKSTARSIGRVNVSVRARQATEFAPKLRTEPVFPSTGRVVPTGSAAGVCVAATPSW